MTWTAVEGPWRPRFPSRTLRSLTTVRRTVVDADVVEHVRYHRRGHQMQRERGTDVDWLTCTHFFTVTLSCHHVDGHCAKWATPRFFDKHPASFIKARGHAVHAV